MHGLNGIFIHPWVKVGKNCTIFQQVTIGQEYGKAPVIGGNCMIGAGAKIIGDVTIGNNCDIGMNAVVTHSFPDNCVIAGVPARLIREKKVMA
jgi:serine O-acetyltransferase